MITITVAGNVGKDPVLRSHNGTPVLGFSVASSSLQNGEKVTQWVDVSIWGKRAESLEPFITKGAKVTAIGEGSLIEHNGKTYLKCRAYDISLQGSGQPAQQRSETRQAPTQQRSAPPENFDEDSDIPF